MRPGLILTAGLVGVALVAGAMAGFANRAASQPGVPAPIVQMTSGAAPLAVLSDQAQPLRAVLANDSLLVLSQVPGQRTLSLHTVTSSGGVTKRDLPLQSGGLWAGLVRSQDGTIWLGSLSQVLAIAMDGSQRLFTFGAPSALLPVGYGAPHSPQGPIENGQITTLGALGTRIFVGRAGVPALTVIDSASGLISEQALPPGTGDVSEITIGGPDELLFTVNHSARTPGQLNDTIGHIGPSGTVRIESRAAQSLAGNGRHVAVGAATLTVEESSGGSPLATVPASDYDLSRIALRSDDVTVARVGADHALAFSANGVELRRVTYQVPIGLDRAGQPRVYNGRLAFLVDSPSGVYFALLGLPNVYRAN